MLSNGNKNSRRNNLNYPVLDAKEAADWDSWSINQKKIDSRLLMGWAGYSIFLDLITRDFFHNSGHFHILAGSGNNGGDGFVVAWHILSACDQKVTIWQSGDPKTEDSKYFYSLCKSPEFTPRLSVRPIEEVQDKYFHENEIVLDAIFGTGLHKPPSKELQNLFTLINSLKSIVRIAVDIPSGIYAGGDYYNHVTFKAHYTYSFGSYKIGHLIEPGINSCGDVMIFPIGFFPKEHNSARRLLRFLPGQAPAPALREHGGHKYTSGVISILGGSDGMEGAATMAAHSFLSLGGGLAKLFSFSSAIKKALVESPEYMIQSFSEGTLLEKAFLDAMPGPNKNHVLIIGPGLKENLSENFWKTLTSAGSINVIIDGSGLSQLWSHEKFFKNHKMKNLVLTPHKGEAERLLGRKITNISNDALEISERYNAHVYLKGPGGILILSSGEFNKEEIYLASKHYELATGGTGDILCGVLANFLCRFHDKTSGSGIEEAMVTYLKAAELVVEKNFKNRDFLTPSELIDCLRESAMIR